ncbi:MAG: prepilin-type N-terminal cleavage/methylation domain-containing protein [Gemmataceae bacterium]
MSRRPGLSLTEVLVALFIMGIGTIAVLTLFPLGALNMAQAFRDDRCTQGAAQADAFLRSYVRERIDSIPNRLTPAPPGGEGFYEALSSPDPKKTFSNYFVGDDSGGSISYPVLIDPIGFKARGGTTDVGGVQATNTWFGADNGFGDGATTPHTTAVSRRSLRSVLDRPPGIQQPLAIRICSQLDGLGYETSGLPATVGGTIDRDGRYNWTWLVQRLSGTATSPVTITVLLFDKRAPGYAPAGAETVWVPTYAVPEMPNVPQRGETKLQFTGSYAANTLPNVQRGGWLLDSSIALINRPATGAPVVVPFRSSGNPPPGAQVWVRNANFYRVVSVTETATGIDVELETPLKADTGWKPGDPQLPASERRFTYFAGLAEVFVRDRPLDLN